MLMLYVFVVIMPPPVIGGSKINGCFLYIAPAGLVFLLKELESGTGEIYLVLLQNKSNRITKIFFT